MLGCYGQPDAFGKSLVLNETKERGPVLSEIGFADVPKADMDRKACLLSIASNSDARHLLLTLLVDVSNFTSIEAVAKINRLVFSLG